jgi:hypothetical protein
VPYLGRGATEAVVGASHPPTIRRVPTLGLWVKYSSFDTKIERRKVRMELGVRELVILPLVIGSDDVVLDYE